MILEKTNLICPSTIQGFLVLSKFQSSPVQSSPVQSSPVQSSPVQSSPVQIKLYSFDIFSILIELDNNIIRKFISIFKKQKKELKHLLPIIKNIEIIKNLVSQDKRVIIISHGKYSSDYIRTALIQFDNIFENIRIYTSHSYSKQKNYRNLYKVISIAENIDYKNWLHFGNSRYLDIIVPSKLGISTYSERVING